LSFGSIEGDMRQRTAPNISGVVCRRSAPRSLALWWTDANTLSNVTSELEPASTQVLFLLTHRVAQSTASWHAQLDMLHAFLNGQTSVANARALSRVIVCYRRRCSEIHHHQGRRDQLEKHRHLGVARLANFQKSTARSHPDRAPYLVEGSCHPILGTPIISC
jgi:hypothetical protein